MAEEQTPTDSLLDLATEALRNAPVPDGPSPQLLQRTSEAVSAARFSASTRRARMAPLLRFAAAAVAAAALVNVVVWFFGLAQPSVAFADVLEKLKQTRTLSARLDSENRLLMKGSVMRLESDDGYMIWNQQTGRQLSVDFEKRQVSLLQMAEAPFDLYSWLRDYEADSAQFIGEKQLAGQRVVGFRITRPPTAFNGTLLWTFWVDPATELPVRIDIEGQAPQDSGQITDLRFDVPLADDLFEMTTPEGYAVIDLGGTSTTQLATPPTTQEAEKLVLKPGVGIGPLEFGASSEQIIAFLGQPDEIYKEFDYRYPSKGLGLLVHPKSGLQVINAYTKEAFAGLFAANDFAGSCGDGLKMGASREQVEAIYGPPVKTTEVGARVILEYERPRAAFTFVSDRLATVVLMRPEN